MEGGMNAWMDKPELHRFTRVRVVKVFEVHVRSETLEGMLQLNENNTSEIKVF